MSADLAMWRRIVLIGCSSCLLCLPVTAQGWRQTQYCDTPLLTAPTCDFDPYLTTTDSLPSPFWYAHGELPLLRVYDGGFLFDPVQSPRMQSAAVRLVGGWERYGGIGARARYFDFRDTSEFFGGGAFTGLEAYSVDLELTQRSRLSGFDTLLFGGVRIGGLTSTVGDQPLTISREFDGGGLTFGVEFNRNAAIWNSVSLFGSFRGSLIYGDTDFAQLGIPNETDIRATVPRGTVASWETQLGVEYRRKTNQGFLFARAGVDAQLWNQPNLLLVTDTNDEPVLFLGQDDNVGLFGPMFAIGIER